MHAELAVVSRFDEQNIQADKIPYRPCDQSLNVNGSRMVISPVGEITEFRSPRTAALPLG